MGYKILIVVLTSSAWFVKTPRCVFVWPLASDASDLKDCGFAIGRDETALLGIDCWLLVVRLGFVQMKYRRFESRRPKCGR